MKKLLPLLLSLTQLPALAEPAVFHDGVLTLPSVIVEQAAGPVLYRNAELRAQGDGSFAVEQFDTQGIFAVESLSVEQQVRQPGTVAVVVQGSKSLECVELEPAVVTRVDNTFHFVIPEKDVPPYVTCLAGRWPMTTEFGIVTTDLEPGEYEIVHGELRVEFELLPPL